MKSVSLASLSSSLPGRDIVAAVFVSVWFVALTAFTGLLYYLLRKRARGSWDHFHRIFWGALALSLWYLLMVVDRWVRHQHTRLSLGFIIFQPCAEVLRVISTIFFLSAAFDIVWRSEDTQRHAWWYANIVMLMLDKIVAFFYLALFLALGVCWLRFTSLNVINDIATRRSQFEVAMAALFMGHAFLILLRAAMINFVINRRVDGHGKTDSLVTAIAALIFFIRFLLEFIMAIIVFATSRSHIDLQRTHDIGYGILTTIFLSFITYLAIVYQPKEISGEPVRVIESNIRKRVLVKLDIATNGGAKRPAPHLKEILDDVEREISNDGASLRPSASSEMNDELLKGTAQNYIARLRREEGWRGQPKLKDDDDAGMGTRPSKLSKAWRDFQSNGSASNGGPSTSGHWTPRQSSAPGLVNPPRPFAERRIVSDGSTRGGTSSTTPSIFRPQFEPVESIQLEDRSRRWPPRTASPPGAWPVR